MMRLAIGRAQESGQLLLPMLGLLFMFGLFLAGYVQWCRHEYWVLRMDMAARATALSAARTQAALLNTIATIQLAENTCLQKFAIPFTDINIGHMQIAARPTFELLNGLLIANADSFELQTMFAARTVANANGSNHIPIPLGTLSHKLEPQGVTVGYFQYLLMVGENRYDTAYFTRKWEPNQIHAQPDHRLGWTVCHDSVCGTAWTRLWLDVDPKNDPLNLNNGGFPRQVESPWRGVGIQCWYPQFNARLMPRGKLL